MVTKYGMSAEVGMIAYGEEESEVFIGRDLAHTRGFSERVASTIDDEVKKLIDTSYQQARDIITQHQDVLDKCAELLLEKEKIGRQEFEALFVNSKKAEEN